MTRENDPPLRPAYRPLLDGLGGYPALPSVTVDELAASLHISVDELLARLVPSKTLLPPPPSATHQVTGQLTRLRSPIEDSPNDDELLDFRRNLARTENRAMVSEYLRRDEARQQQLQTARQNVLLPSLSEPSTAHIARRRLLWIGGHEGNHHFSKEFGAADRALSTAAWQVVAHPALALEDWAGKLDQHFPEILHISAHATTVGIHLTDPDNSESYLHAAPETIAKVLKSANSVPALIIFNWCQSNQTVRAVIDEFGLEESAVDSPVTLVYWDTDTDDEHCLRWSRTFYRQINHFTPSIEAALTRVKDTLDHAFEGLNWWPRRVGTN